MAVLATWIICSQNQSGSNLVKQWVQPLTAVDNSDISPTRLTGLLTLLILALIQELCMLLISSSEDRYDLSHRRVPARVLPYPFSGSALASWLAPSPAFPLTNRS